MPNPIKIRAIAEKVTSEAPGQYLVEMKPEGRIPRFKPGQFLHLAIDDYDPAGGFWPESRVFSITSSPTEETISIVFSVKGAYTSRMASALVPGKALWLKLPYGDFVIEKNIHEGQDAVVVAGGTGISPFIPYFKGLANSPTVARKVVLYYGIRRRVYLLFPELIAECVESIDGFSASIVIEEESPGDMRIGGARIGSGRLSIKTIRDETKGLRDPVYFLSGPPAMIQKFKLGLSDEGIMPENIKIDEWE